MRPEPDLAPQAPSAGPASVPSSVPSSVVSDFEQRCRAALGEVLRLSPRLQPGFDPIAQLAASHGEPAVLAGLARLADQQRARRDTIASWTYAGKAVATMIAEGKLGGPATPPSPAAPEPARPRWEAVYDDTNDDPHVHVIIGRRNLLTGEIQYRAHAIVAASSKGHERDAERAAKGLPPVPLPPPPPVRVPALQDAG